ncbi:peptidase, M23 family [Formosa agariphila KMM 3901]|uniref:Peptidase, M23 family n=1 Tax=Formosa agariphila (strain DSM 15362 / KCTC 12365 / LMG 23005 / KMM 3901 / M-2Alg 35-1) TaxID=1347342 RepID=T2KNK6_FORAG|nr:M23 family metallopeptidase [Formosa agariphila]CDF79579.1 peptidase, M23 family [Formosa agariphila KMM 3901]
MHKLGMKQYITILLTLLIITSCKQTQQITDAITKPTAKTVFERSFKGNDSVFQDYEARYHKALNNTLQLELPTVIQLKSDTSGFKILAYTLDLKQGERLKIETDDNTDSLQLVLDMFTLNTNAISSKKPVISNTTESNSISFKVTSTNQYKFVMIPNGTVRKNFSIKLYTVPTLAFPVSGKDNKAVQSFWGAVRSGGKRSHEGIDIFAKRGTPVVASTNGFITDTGNRGLGGKQVWLRDGIFGSSLYYAHLDSIAVSRGNKVNVGDTLGFVGNTGNAKTTSPHLHFGIYTNAGAVDPYPFIKLTEQIEFKKGALIDVGKTRLQKNELRISPDTKSQKRTDLPINTQVNIVAKTNRWYHTRVQDTLEGFIHESLIQTAQ